MPERSMDAEALDAIRRRHGLDYTTPGGARVCRCGTADCDALYLLDEVDFLAVLIERAIDAGQQFASQVIATVDRVDAVVQDIPEAPRALGKHDWELVGFGGGWQVWECSVCKRNAIPPMFGFIWPWPKCDPANASRMGWFATFGQAIGLSRKS